MGPITLANFLVAAAAVSATAAALSPHVLVILVDDWGHANVGFHASALDRANNETQTPNLDALAADGIILERHYTFRFCSPTRSALHTGRNPIHVNVFNSDLATVNKNDPISGYAGIPVNMTSFPELLRDAGYATQMAGKWHIGLARMRHLPIGRGYQRSLVYLDGSNSYWDNTCTGWCPYTSSNKFTDLWENSLPAWGRNNSWGCTQISQAGCTYEDDMFTDFLVEGIAAHNASQPLLTYFAPHSVHVASDPGLPLEVPDAALARFAFINDTSRRFYAAMVNTVDAQIGRIIDAVKAQGMWEKTLVIVSADNGGLVYPDGHFGASNFPLKGGKQANWEGGVRSNALVSGGFVPVSRRGTVETGWAGIEDWYTTLGNLAGADTTDPAAAAAGLPPVDGVDLWPMLSGANSTSPRTEIWLGADDGGSHATIQGVINADGFKALINSGGPVDMAFWTGELQPNGTNTPAASMDCGNVTAPKCLYNVLQDPTEHVNLADAHPDILQQLAARIAELQRTVFDPDRGNPDPLACNMTATKWRGFVGPFLGPLPI